MKSTYNSKTAIDLAPKKESKSLEINRELRDKLNWVMQTKGALASKIIQELGSSDPKESD